MSYFPRIRPILGLAAWCGFLLAALVASIVGAMGGVLVAGVVR